MNSLIWLAMEMAVLLLVAGLVFFYLGWRWRGTPVLAAAPHSETEPEPTAEDSAPVVAKQAVAPIEPAPAVESDEVERLKAELDDAQGHRRNLERELMRLRDDLKFTRVELNRLRDLSAQEQPIEASAPVPAPAPAVEPLNLWTKPVPAEPEVQPEPVPTPEPATPNIEIPPEAAARLETIGKELSRVRSEQAALRKQRADMVVEQEIAIDKHDVARRGAAAMKLREAEQRLAGLDGDLTALENQDRALRHTLNLLSVAEGDEDDLTKIKGVKAVLNKKLHAFGVRTYRQIAEWSEEDVAAFSELLAFKNRIKRDKWQEQARKLDCDK
ncbi:MAG: hypothetical protein KDK97_04260 [Verrucomicrobiales bacterium]|nr:hypothetical protein [Verrucomicrobiales bacterium]MCP5559008.1 hypothetical protein [Verrucomicrobiaceae bacterium]